MKETNKKLIVKCSKCKVEFNYYDSEFRPFCSEKCQMVDMGHWFSEEYSVASSTPVQIDEFADLSALENFDEGY